MLVVTLASADSLCKQFGPRSGPGSGQQKHEKLPSMQSVKHIDQVKMGIKVELTVVAVSKNI